MVRILKENENLNEPRFEVEIKALQKIEIDDGYYPEDESSLTYELYSDGNIDMDRIQKYMEFDSYYPDNKVILEYVDFDDWFMDEDTGDDAWVSIIFKIASEKPLDKSDYEETAEALIEYMADEHLKVSISGEVVYYRDEWDYHREDVYQSRHVDENYSETAGVHVVHRNNPVQIQIVKSTKINNY